MNRKLFLPILVLIAVIGVALIIGISQPNQATDTAGLRQVKYQVGGQEQVVLLKPISVDAFSGSRYVFGNANAPVTVVEFADYQCPACGVFANTYEPELERRLVDTGKIRYAFRDFPLSIHPNAPVAARAAACVNAQNSSQFKAYHKLLFAAQAEWSSLDQSQAARKLLDYAAPIADVKKLQTCLESNALDAEIQHDMQAGTQVNLSGTPSFVFISQKGAYLMAGAMSVEGFEAVIAELQ